MALDDDTRKALEYEAHFDTYRKDNDDLGALFKEAIDRGDLDEAARVSAKLDELNEAFHALNREYFGSAEADASRSLGEAAAERFFRKLERDYPLPSTTTADKREPIPERVRHEVWRRDQGQCVDCGSRERLEFDHIIPVSGGGSNTARNIELRCEPCNRKKAAKI
jgi:hypothetical protein